LIGTGVRVPYCRYIAILGLSLRSI